MVYTDENEDNTSLIQEEEVTEDPHQQQKT